MCSDERGKVLEPVSVVLTSLLSCMRDQIPAVVLSSPWQSNEEGPVPRRDSLLCCGLKDGWTVE